MWYGSASDASAVWRYRSSPGGSSAARARAETGVRWRSLNSPGPMLSQSARTGATTVGTSAIALARLFSGGHEIERCAVHAIAEPGGGRPVVEDVAEVAAAAAAVDLGADHEEATVARGPDGTLERRPEARPPGPAVELGLRGEQGQVTPGAVVRAGPILLV